jgi:hypothetical protein
MVTITIKTDNEAFEDRSFEIARILRDIADKYESGQDMDGRAVMDFNGNRVGRITEED